MQKKTIPILVSLMAISLLGIIIIQYTWIRKTVDEKQAIIDNNLYSAVENIDEKLSIHQTLSIFDNTIIDQLINLEVQMEEIDDSIMHTIAVVKNLENNVPMHYHSLDTSSKPSIQIVSTIDNVSNLENEIVHLERQLVLLDARIEKFENLEFVEDLQAADNIDNFEYKKIFIEGVDPNGEDSLIFIEYANEMGKAKHVFNKLKFELLESDDNKFDSTLVTQYLEEEFISHNLSIPNTWGVFNTDSEEYIIQPSSTNDMDYKIALFTTDILHPGLYEIHLNLNQNELIWREIWVMVLLSVLFLLIMTFVFSYSIKLAIKHKNISEIKSDFINNMTHEFKTPLASISLASDSILHPSTNFEPEAIKKYIKIIQDEKSKLNLHVERILEVASLNNDALNIPNESIELKTVINRSISKLGLLIEKEKAIISFNYDKSVTILANQQHLENVFVNLIENGIKYSNSNANITININVENQDVIVNIIDQGIGMSKTQVQKAFDNFYRVESGNIHNTKGFGLGLSYCKLVLDKMGGLIQLKSELNKGTTVQLKFKKL